MDNSQPELLTISMQPGDWQVVLTGLTKLPIEFGLGTLTRLQQALAEAQKPAALVPRIVEASDG